MIWITAWGKEYWSDNGGMVSVRGLWGYSCIFKQSESEWLMKQNVSRNTALPQQLLLNCSWARHQSTNCPGLPTARQRGFPGLGACVLLVRWCMCLPWACLCCRPAFCQSPVETFAAVWPNCHWRQTQTFSIVMDVFCLHFAPRRVRQTQRVSSCCLNSWWGREITLGHVTEVPGRLWGLQNKKNTTWLF